MAADPDVVQIAEPILSVRTNLMCTVTDKLISFFSKVRGTASASPVSSQGYL